MSLWDDYKSDAQFARDFPHGVNHDEWTTREGKVLKLKNMTTEHIKNCMRMLGDTCDFYHVFAAELKRRGESLDSGAAADFASICAENGGAEHGGQADSV